MISLNVPAEPTLRLFKVSEQRLERAQAVIRERCREIGGEEKFAALLDEIGLEHVVMEEGRGLKLNLTPLQTVVLAAGLVAVLEMGGEREEMVMWEEGGYGELV